MSQKNPGEFTAACCIEEVEIPNSVRELCDHCFYCCPSLRRVTFAQPSSVERIGVYAFARKSSGNVTACCIEEIEIPNRVRELCDRCFYGCWSLRRVTFAQPSSVERIGVEAFSCEKNPGEFTAVCCIEEIEIPDSVRELCDRCFYRCSSLRRVIFGASSSLERIGVDAFPEHIEWNRNVISGLED